MNETEDERQWGYYNWQEVHGAREKLSEMEREQEGDLQTRALEESSETTDGPNEPLVTNS